MNKVLYYSMGRYLMDDIKRKIWKNYDENRKCYCGKTILNGEEAQVQIRRLLLSDKPCMIARYGSTELRCITGELLSKDLDSYPLILRKSLRRLINRYQSFVQKALWTYSGFFAAHEEWGNEYKRFLNLMLESSKNIDMIAVWFNRLEDYMIEQNMDLEKIKIVRLTALEPYYWKSRWTDALAGKKVLVIHPFTETIKKQYEIKDKIFARQILPDFELKTLKSVQTLAEQKDNRFSSWFEALDYMVDEALNIDFDIALIGCGAYGFSLAAKLKENGKKVLPNLKFYVKLKI